MLQRNVENLPTPQGQKVQCCVLICLEEVIKADDILISKPSQTLCLMTRFMENTLRSEVIQLCNQSLHDGQRHMPCKTLYHCVTPTNHNATPCLGQGCVWDSAVCTYTHCHLRRLRDLSSHPGQLCYVQVCFCCSLAALLKPAVSLSSKV